MLMFFYGIEGLKEAEMNWGNEGVLEYFIVDL